MSVDQMIEFLEQSDAILESYVLCREIRVFLNIGETDFHPQVKIKIYRSNVISDRQYHFRVSHHVHTPLQASPYHPSNTNANTEIEAIREAIYTTTCFFQSAIDKGLEPDESWLVKDEDF